MQGNPLVSCLEVGCSSSSECASNKKCDYLTSSSTRKECQPLCRRNPCAAGASCTANNHREICTCDYPLQGDGYISCTECKLVFSIPFKISKVWHCIHFKKQFLFSTFV